MLADSELPRVIAATALTEFGAPWIRAIHARHLTAAPPGAPAGSPPQPLWAGGARLYGGRFSPKGSFDTLYLASDLVTLGLGIGAVFLRPIGSLAQRSTAVPLDAPLDVVEERLRLGLGERLRI
jgi:hypothetical protein